MDYEMDALLFLSLLLLWEIRSGCIWLSTSIPRNQKLCKRQIMLKLQCSFPKNNNRNTDTIITFLRVGKKTKLITQKNNTNLEEKKLKKL